MDDKLFDFFGIGQKWRVTGVHSFSHVLLESNHFHSLQLIVVRECLILSSQQVARGNLFVSFVIERRIIDSRNVVSLLTRRASRSNL